MSYFEVSAKTKENVQTAFNKLMVEVYYNKELKSKFLED